MAVAHVARFVHAARRSDCRKFPGGFEKSSPPLLLLQSRGPPHAPQSDPSSPANAFAVPELVFRNRAAVFPSAELKSYSVTKLQRSPWIFATFSIVTLLIQSVMVTGVRLFTR